MSTALKSGSTTTRIGLATNHETIVTIKRGAWDRDTIEVRFETLFAGAQDPLALQLKAQFFLSEDQLFTLNQNIQSFLDADRTETGQHPSSDGVDRFGVIGLGVVGKDVIGTGFAGSDVGRDEKGTQ